MSGRRLPAALWFLAALCLPTFCLPALCLPAGVQAQDSADTQVVIWHAYRGREEAALQEAARNFEEAHPGVHLQLLAQPFGAYASKLESAIPTGHGPDLFIDAHERLAGYVQGHLLAPVSASASMPEATQLEGLSEEHLNALIDGGTLWGLPIALKCGALYLNNSLLPEDPATLEDLQALVGQLPEGISPLVMEADNAYWAASLVHAYGGQLIDGDGHWALSSLEAVAALTHLRSLVEDGVVPEETTGDLVKRLFSDGRAAAAISGPWLAPDLPESLDWRVRPLPAIRGADGQMMRPYLTVEAVYVAAGGEQPVLARLFAHYLANGGGALVRAQRARQIVTDSRVWSDPSVADDAFLQSFRDAASEAVPLPSHPNMRMAFVPAQRAIRKILRHTATVQEAVDEGGHRFEDVTRPPPPPGNPTFGFLILGVLLTLGLVQLVSRLKSAEFRSDLKRSIPAYRYVAHAVVAVGLLVILPLLVGAATSFFAGRYPDMHYVGFANYISIITSRGGDLLGHGSFWLVLLVTVLWTLVNVGLHLVIGISLALLLHRPYLRMKGLYRVLLILPWAVPNYVTALAWRGLFHRQFGAVNAILESVGVEPISWFSNWATAFTANVATNVWLGFPFMMVVTLGALTAIPKDVYEAAAVDGANSWQRFRLITVPLLKPFLMPAVAMGSVWTFNMFNVIFLVSVGEPDGTTEILVSEAYRWAFTRGNQYGYAAAYAVLIFLVLFIGTRSMSRAITRD